MKSKFAIFRRLKVERERGVKLIIFTDFSKIGLKMGEGVYLQSSKDSEFTGTFDVTTMFDVTC